MAVHCCVTFDPSFPLASGVAYVYIQSHCCPVKSRTESVGWNQQLADLCSSSAEVRVKWAFSRTE
jgi:hypothetical protein